MKSKIVKLLTFALFNVLPVILVMLAVVMHFSRGNFYMVHVDPEYFHLFNGLNLAIFNLAIDFIHHPGTSIQVIYALSAPVVNLTMPGGDLITNAMKDPETFIHGANVLLNLLTAASLVALGWYAYRKSGNLMLSLLLQMMPFASFHVVAITGRLIPETAMIAPLLLLCLTTVIYIHDEESSLHQQKYVFAFAIIGGLGMSAKFLYFPFLVAPLFMIPAFRMKARYILYTMAATVIFAFPVFVHLGKSVSWFGNMFLHSGKWGAGQATVLDPRGFSQALQEMYRIDPGFFVLLVLLILSILLGLGMIIYKPRPSLNRLPAAALGIAVSVTISILVIGKHFAAHYYFPTLLTKFFILYLIALLIIRVIDVKYVTFLISLAALAAGMVFSLQQVAPLAANAESLREKALIFENRQQVLNQYDTRHHPLIITSHYRGSVFRQSAMVGGFLMSGPLKSTFREELLKQYPDTYFYYDWTDMFYNWDLFKPASAFAEPDEPVYVFIGEGKEMNLTPIIERLNSAIPGYRAEAVLLEQFHNPTESFYEVRFRKENKENE